MADRNTYAGRLRASLADMDPDCTVKVSDRPGDPFHFAGSVDLETLSHIQLDYDTRWRWQRQRKLRSFCSARSISDPVETTLDFILHHEVGHRHICPGSPSLGVALNDAVAQALAAHQREGMTDYVVNLVADMIVNVHLAHVRQKPADGILIDWYDQGTTPTTLPAKVRTALGLPPTGFSELFAIFVAVQLQFLNQEDAETLLNPFLPRAELAPAVQAVSQLRRLIDTALVAEDRIAAWPALFGQAAAILAPFCPPSPPHAPSHSHPWLGPDTPAGARKRGSPTWYDPERRQVFREPGKGSHNVDALDYYYRHQARALRLSPVRHLQARAKPSHLSNLSLTPAAQELADKANQLQHLIFAVDTSSSVTFGGQRGPDFLPWNVGCQYDRILVFLYRVAQWVEVESVIESLNIIVFASSVRSTGWFRPSAEVFRKQAGQLLFNPPTGGTDPHPEEIEREVRAAGVGVRLFILTDGQGVSNEDKTIKVLVGMRDAAQSVLFLFNKTETSFSTKMRAAGFPVYLANDLEHLDDLLVEDIETVLPSA